MFCGAVRFQVVSTAVQFELADVLLSRCLPDFSEQVEKWPPGKEAAVFLLLSIRLCGKTAALLSIQGQGA